MGAVSIEYRQAKGSCLAALAAFAIFVFATALIFGRFVRFNFHAVIYLGQDAGEKALLLRRNVFFLIRVFGGHNFFDLLNNKRSVRRLLVGNRSRFW
jgi:hypothetical protein